MLNKSIKLLIFSTLLAVGAYLVSSEHVANALCSVGYYCAGSVSASMPVGACGWVGGVCQRTYNTVTYQCDSNCNITGFPYVPIGTCIVTGTTCGDSGGGSQIPFPYSTCCAVASVPPPPPTPTCGNGTIDPGETCVTCPADAGVCVASFCGCIGCDRDESTPPGSGSCIRDTNCGYCPDGQGEWWCKYPSDNYCPGETPPPPPPSPPGVGGYVRNPNGQYLPNIPMRLELHSGTNQVTYTNSAGYFYFGDLPQGVGYNVVPEWTRTGNLSLAGYRSAVTGSSCGNDFWCKDNSTGGQTPLGSPSYNNQVTARLMFDNRMYGEDCGTERCLIPNANDNSGICNDPQNQPWPQRRHCNFVFTSYNNSPPYGYFHDITHSRNGPTGWTQVRRWFDNNNNLYNTFGLINVHNIANVAPTIVYAGDQISSYATARDVDNNLVGLRVVRQKWVNGATSGAATYYTRSPCSGGSCFYGVPAWTVTEADATEGGRWLYWIEARDATTSSFETWGWNGRCTALWWAPINSWSSCGNGSFFWVNVRPTPTYTMSGTVNQITPIPTGQTCTTLTGGPNYTYIDSGTKLRMSDVAASVPDPVNERFTPNSTGTAIPGDWNLGADNTFSIPSIPAGTGSLCANSSMTASGNAALGISYRLRCLQMPNGTVYNMSTCVNGLPVTAPVANVRLGYEQVLTYASGWAVGYVGDVYGRSVNFVFPPPSVNTFRLGMGNATVWGLNYFGVEDNERAATNRWVANVSDTFWPASMDLAVPAMASTTSTINGIDANKSYVMSASDFNNLMGGTGTLNYALNQDGVAVVYVTGTTPLTITKNVTTLNNNRRVVFVTQLPVSYSMPGLPGVPSAMFAMITSSTITFPTLANPDITLNVEGPLASVNLNTGGGDIIIQRNLQVNNATTPAVIVNYNSLYLRELRKFANNLRQHNIIWETD